MLKLTVSVDGIVLMEHVGDEETIFGFMNDGGRIAQIIDKQGWYGFASLNEEKGVTFFYKIVPHYSKSVVES